MYKWGNDAKKGAFVMPRHGSISKPTAATDYQTNPEVFRVIKSNIEEDKLSSEIHKNINTGTTNSVSMEVRNPMYIYNLQRAFSSTPSGSEKNSFEINNLIRQIQENNGIFMQSMYSNQWKHYIQYSNEKKNWNDLSRFCVHGLSVLCVDTTSEIIDNLWLTDTSFTNESLIDENKSHP